MVELLKKAFDALKTLPAEDRERIAWEIIERVEDKAEWDKIISAQKSQRWLEKEAARALKEYEKISKPLAMSFISLGNDNLLREEAYWRHFDDLPAEIRKLAEANYRLWRKNPHHPRLRFKKIHTELPIFSFRVGMRHRTVGVETDDGKVAWFWMGSFGHFQQLVSAVETIN